MSKAKKLDYHGITKIYRFKKLKLLVLQVSENMKIMIILNQNGFRLNKKLINPYSLYNIVRMINPQF